MHADVNRNAAVSLNAAWLVRLRWLAAAGQLATVLLALGAYQIQLPLAPLLGVVGFTAITNLALAWWLRHRQGVVAGPETPHPALLAAVMAVDLASLTMLLYFTGGVTNPFAVFFLVNLALAAVVLPRPWAWSLTAGAVICFAMILVVHRPVPELEQRSNGQHMSLWEQGMLAAFFGCATVTTYFITRLTKELRRRENELRIAEQQRARSERLEALATLAAGAGHELASPLSTIAVVAKELSRHLVDADAPASVREDVELIRSELDHCRNILHRMAGNAGQMMGEEVSHLTIGEFLDDVLSGLRRPGLIDLQVSDEDRLRPIQLPLQSMAQSLRGVLQNALDASAPEATVQLRVVPEGEDWLFETRDQGSGMTPETLARAGEPFFTTKDTGQGMGMGLFLARSVVERLGGSLEIESTPGNGAVVSIHLPAF
ncbi:ATP-binding protein [Lignipirellula cremea]|uniref:histidine kinase n=1 Tax=Lignipirellula cremea TaxID=2528010 RepID=A0A518DTY4_9BACT|nr:ATP-binding protein [Lignipirellula cremea]QDU95301.1 Sensor histidine kinase RegB [Lignipirellula cremea]